MRLLLPALLLTACVEDLAPPAEDPVVEDPVDDGADTDETAEDRPKGIDGPDADGWFTVEVDASDPDTWVYLDLEGPTWGDEGTWDLAFRRYVVEVDGGVSGDGGIEVAWVDVPFEDGPPPPADGWITDREDGDDDDAEPDRAFDTWWDYDPSTHVLTPKDRTWFVRRPDGRTWAVGFLGYYSEFGDSGHPAIVVRELL